MENNPVEAVNNVGGSITLADMAGELQVPNFAMIPPTSGEPHQHHGGIQAGR